MPAGRRLRPTRGAGLADGAVYDVGTGRWHPVAEAPVPVEPFAHAVVWQDDVVIQGGTDELRRYSPAEDAWTTVPAPPAGGILAAGDRLVAVGASDEVNGQGDDWVLDGAGVAWTELPEDPIGAVFDRQMVWTGDALVLLAASLDPTERNPTFVQAARLTDPFGAAEWELLPDSTVLAGSSGWVHTPWGVVNVTAGGADGGQTNGFGRTLPYGGVLRLDPPAWRELPTRPEGGAGPMRTNTGSASADGHLLLRNGWVLDLTTGDGLPSRRARRA